MKKSYAGIRGTSSSSGYRTINFEEDRAIALYANRTLNKSLIDMFDYYIDLIPYKGRAKYEIIENVSRQDYNKLMEWVDEKRLIIKKRTYDHNNSGL